MALFKLFKKASRILLSKVYSYIPKKENIWLFGSGGTFCDNSKYLYLYIINNHKSINAIWIAKNRDELKILKEKGYKAYHKYSCQGILSQLIADKVFYSNYIRDFWWILIIGSTKVNLWHGIGVKRIEFNLKDGPIAHIFNGSLKSKIMYYPHYVKPDYMLSSSEYISTNVFKDAFRLEDNQLLNYGYPRCEYLLSPEKFNNKLSTKILSNREIIKKYRHTYLYVPTWRSTNKNFFSEIFYDLDLLNEVCKKNNDFFCIKLHFNTPGIEELAQKDFSNLLFLDRKTDLYEYLDLFSCIITDYSSIYYDFIIQKNKKAILFPFDYSEYLQNEQSPIIPYYESISGSVVHSFKELTVLLEDYDKIEFVSPDIAKIFWGEVDKKSCSRIVSKMVKKD
ncbi:CDP-glycerol glycerophosphotransferase family protein [Halosquirtibacter laminarini]|uniref:CDP-glycerol glycerophosphotransferase family protein n=1 Tax=Halosquirtibacter laminarini TaxID=3374600 RepID=A0AC61NP36_9BACT|nr:CDP-glycerol glycerophosphotransferase family protein [Prolixibacteraceae bacterium]